MSVEQRCDEVFLTIYLCFQKLLELNNIHSLVSIVSALQSAPIFRLNKTWGVRPGPYGLLFKKKDIYFYWMCS